jgi:hypothetical protein
MPAVSSIEAFTRDPVVDDGGLGVDGGTDAASTGGVGVAGAGEFVVGMILSSLMLVKVEKSWLMPTVVMLSQSLTMVG